MLVGVAIAGMGGLTAALVQNDKFPRQNKQRHIRRRACSINSLVVVKPGGANHPGDKHGGRSRRGSAWNTAAIWHQGRAIAALMMSSA
jgi:hypothetical protein